MDKLRLFIAIDIDKDGLNKISQFQSSLKKETKEIRWTDISTWHLTLKFLGEQKRALLDDISEICNRATKLVQPFCVNICKADAFPNIKLPRVIFLNVEQNENLVRLAHFFEDNFTSFGISKEERPFHPHITLGRIKDPKTFFLKNPNFSNTFQTKGDTFCHSFNVSDFCLYQSILKKEGPEYLVAKRFPFN